MRPIPPYALYLGNALDARNLRQLYDLQITTVVDLALKEPPAQLGRDITYCRFPLIDGEGNPPHLLRLAIVTVVHLIKSQVPTLVACGAGMSRSPAIVAEALSKIEGKPPDASLAQLVQCAPHDVSLSLWDEVRRLIF